MRLGISVVVCTYNGATLIPDAIRYIAQQQVRPGTDWEFILVDNASTDDTARVAVTEWAKYGLSVPLTVLHQPRQGLTYARELALEKSKYEFVLFCDDDNWLNPNYVNLSYELMCQHHTIGVLGGYGELVFEAGTPLWAIGHGSFANGPQAKESGKVKHNVVYGAGFVMRKSAYKTILSAGFQSMLSDRSGKCLSAGGDWELCFAIALVGYDIWYDEQLRFKHLIPKERISWDYCVRFFKEGAQSFEVLIPYRIRVNMGSRKLHEFNLKLLKVFLSQASKLFPLLAMKARISKESQEAKLLQLKFIAWKARMMSFKNYANMRRNFLNIIELENKSLLSNIQDEKYRAGRGTIRLSKVTLE